LDVSIGQRQQLLNRQQRLLWLSRGGIRAAHDSLSINMAFFGATISDPG